MWKKEKFSLRRLPGTLENGCASLYNLLNIDAKGKQYISGKEQAEKILLPILLHP